MEAAPWVILEGQKGLRPPYLPAHARAIGKRRTSARDAASLRFHALIDQPADHGLQERVVPNFVGIDLKRK